MRSQADSSAEAFIHRAWPERQFGLRIRAHPIKAIGRGEGCGSWERSLSPWDRMAGAFYRALGLRCSGGYPVNGSGVSSTVWGIPSRGFVTQAKEGTKYKNDSSREKCQISSQHQKVVINKHKKRILSPCQLKRSAQPKS